MSDEHKQALAQGRSESSAVRRYLEVLEAHKPRRGRKQTPESINKRLEKIQDELDKPGTKPMAKLLLVQEAYTLSAELDSLEASDDLPAIEAEFVKAAKGFSDRKGISAKAWRELGVPADVLRKAGVA